MKTTTEKFLPKRGHNVHFQHRGTMARRVIQQKAFLRAVPPTPLPVDCTGSAKVVAPMDGNDQLGDCMEAMACHVDNIWTFGRGQSGWTQSSFDLTALENQYEAASGGDNGLDEPTLLQQCWKPGLAGISAASYVDSLDVDVTNVTLAQYLIDQFFHICLMWSVPDDFLQGFNTGTVWPNADTPDPANGHGVPLTDIGGPGDVSGGVSLNGFYRLFTWGTWCWVSPAFVASVQPACFVVFSARQFNPTTGYDAHGRHVTTQAAIWQSLGGNPIPAAVINSFPPAGPPSPPPPPSGPDSLTIGTPLPAGTYVVPGGNLVLSAPLAVGSYPINVPSPAPPPPPPPPPPSPPPGPVPGKALADALAAQTAINAVVSDLQPSKK